MTRNQLEVVRRRGRHELYRALGLLTLLARVGPAARRPSLHRLLVRAGVLDRFPEAWDESPRIAQMPWGAGVVASDAHPPEGVDGPWPQRPVVDDDLYAPVLGLEREDIQQHLRDNVLRYMGQLAALVPVAAARALTGPRVIAIDDAELGRLIGETCFSQFVCRTLDPADRRMFGALVEGDGSDFAKVDASAVDPGRALAGIECAPTVTLLRREPTGDLRPVAIAVQGKVLRPTDGSAWELARYFVLQGLGYLLVLVFHPRLHFPNDVINAVTRSLLPRGHVLFKLLAPFMDLTLGLHAAVIHHRRSVLHNSQREIFTPFPVSTEAIHGGVALGRRGLEGNSAYPPYRFGSPWMDGDFAYGRYRGQWFEAVHELCCRVLAGVAPRDACVGAWADAIHSFSPTFPDGAAISHCGALAHAAAHFIAAGSVFHTADHHSYAAIPIERVPWRLRRPPMLAPGGERLVLDDLVTPEDSFRHRLCHAMFFRPHVLRSLRQLRWTFRHPTLLDAVRSFGVAMDALDESWRDSGFPTSHEIASSAQY